MILYHYTAKEYLESIMREGLTKGDVPTSREDGVNAVWLTADPSSNGHGLSDGGEVPDEQREVAQKRGDFAPPGIRYANKRAVRIKVVVPTTDRALKPWLQWARKRLEPEWLDSLNRLGGGKAKAETWYLYFGTISPKRFVTVEVDGESVPLDDHTTGTPTTKAF